MPWRRDAGQNVAARLKGKETAYRRRLGKRSRPGLHGRRSRSGREYYFLRNRNQRQRTASRREIKRHHRDYPFDPNAGQEQNRALDPHPAQFAEQNHPAALRQPRTPDLTIPETGQRTSDSSVPISCLSGIRFPLSGINNLSARQHRLDKFKLRSNLRRL